MTLSDSRHFRRRVAGIAMVLAPLLAVLAETLHAKVETDATKQLAGVAKSTDRWYAAHLLVLVMLMLLVPAFLGLVHLLRESSPALGNTGLVFFVPGVIGVAAVVGAEFVLWKMAQAANREEMVALAKSVNESAGFFVVLLFALLFPIAWLLVGIGLYRSRAVATWSAALIALAQPVGFAAELAGGPKAIAVAAQIAFAIGLIPVGIRVLRQSDSEWEPEPAGAPMPATT